MNVSVIDDLCCIVTVIIVMNYYITVKTCLVIVRSQLAGWQIAQIPGFLALFPGGDPKLEPEKVQKCAPWRRRFSPDFAPDFRHFRHT